jgi:hypothetical protein
VAGHIVKYVQSSFLTGVQINPVIDKKEFGLLNIEFDPSANRKPENFWSTVRLDSLTKKEKNTYRLYDSVSANTLVTLNSAVKLAEALVAGKFTVGRFYIPIERLFRANKYEDFRFGIGVQTGERISRIFALDSYIAYGVKDKAMKYGGGIQFNLYPQKELFLKLSYAHDIMEPGNPDFIKSPVTATGGEVLRNVLTYRMDSVEQFKALISVRPFKFSQLTTFVQQQRHNPAYEYIYQQRESSPERFTVSEAGIQWRYAFRENYAQMGNTSIVTSFAYPQVNLVVSRALSTLWEGQFDFTKVELKADYQFLIRAFGKTSLQFAAGYIEGATPYPYLFNGKGSRFGTSLFNSIVVPNYFQTMGLYEFTSDRYANLFLTHHFGRIVGTKPRYFRPELSVTHNMGIGSLRDPTAHSGLVLQSFEKGFSESGITLNNVLRFKYLNIVYVGFGLGAFFRYGNYAYASASDNLVLKLALNLSL